MKKLDYVNALIGSFNEPRYSNGNIYPIVSRPFGMANFTLQTHSGSNWFYNPTSHCVEGIRLTHQPSPWVGDYGHMLLMPFADKFYKEAHARWSSYRPNQTTIKPDRLSVYFQRYRILTEMTTTERGGYFRFTGRDRNTGVAFITYGNSCFSGNGNVLTGWTQSNNMWGFDAFKEYFYVQFSSPISRVEEIENGGVAVYFDTPNVEMKLSTSFISQEQAQLNFERELMCVDFEQAQENSANAWEELLGSIDVSNENEDRTRTFYSCFYRALLYPRMFHEYDANGQPYHFNADTKKCEKGVFYTDNGFWDTYRTVYPLLSIIRPKLVEEMIEGFVNYSEETGWLPKWLSPGEIGIMPGTLVEAVIADACVKGIISSELRTRAYKALKKSAYQTGEGKHGRQAIADYIKYGYVPNDCKESINHTCDCAYGDYCISAVAKMEGDNSTASELEKRSKNYANLFDKQTCFLRSRDRDGNFRKSFNPYEWGGDNCEGSSWQNSFAVYHDIEGLIALYGGKQKFEARLDELFSAEPIFDVGEYAQEIHEMSEMACVDFGQMAISNQPSFHLPWLYAFCGRRDKVCSNVENLANNAFSCDIEGFPGDEDNGTTSAWYMFACMGFYPVCPGKDVFVCSKPLFESIKINGRSIKKEQPDFASTSQLFE